MKPHNHKEQGPSRTIHAVQFDVFSPNWSHKQPGRALAALAMAQIAENSLGQKPSHRVTWL